MIHDQNLFVGRERKRLYVAWEWVIKIPEDPRDGLNPNIRHVQGKDTYQVFRTLSKFLALAPIARSTKGDVARDPDSYSIL